MIVLRDLMAPMRDGIRLATDVYLPGREGEAPGGPFPVILERTMYDKTATSRSERRARNATPLGRTEVAAYFAGHGYAVAYQATRGRYRSEGRFAKYASEAKDGYDHRGLADAAELVQRAGRHHGSLLRRPHSVGAGQPEPARSRRAVPRCRATIRTST